MPVVPINIHVHETDQANGENKGTFTEPHPKIKVSTNAAVEFHLIGQTPDATFKVRFNGFQFPFQSLLLDFDQNSPQQKTSQTPGRFHYTVQVTLKDGTQHSIENCPELDVG